MRAALDAAEAAHAHDELNERAMQDERDEMDALAARRDEHAERRAERAERLVHAAERIDLARATRDSEQLEATLRAKEELAQSTQASHGAVAKAAANLEDLRTEHASIQRAINKFPPHDTTTRALETSSRILLSKIYEAKATLTATMQNTGSSAVDDDEQSVRSAMTGASSSTRSSARRWTPRRRAPTTTLRRHFNSPPHWRPKWSTRTRGCLRSTGRSSTRTPAHSESSTASCATS